MNSTLIKATASSVVLGVSLMGCTHGPNLFRPQAASANANDRTADKAHERAQKAMTRGDLASALAAMEQAVELSPQDVGYRKTLAELYMKSGRFVSAETTFADVLKLNPGDAKASFFVAVCQLAQGRTDAALVQLGAMDYTIDRGDLGLAYALAGDTRRAIRLLEPAARDAAATGRVRQNLALAYALAGDWRRARVLAEQDVNPAEVGRRLQQWALLASAGAPESRVAMMFGVSPAIDPGQPTRLALVPAAPAAAEASAEATQPAVPEAATTVESAPAVTAEAQPAAARVVQAAAPVVTATATPASAPVTTPASASAAPGFTPVAKPVAKPRATKASLPIMQAHLRNGGSQFVVQIGAYDSAAVAEGAWGNLVRRYKALSGYQPVSTTVNIPGKGMFHRLAVAGFTSQGDAASLCRALKAQGASCFVRATAGDAPVQWAARSSRKA